MPRFNYLFLVVMMLVVSKLDAICIHVLGPCSLPRSSGSFLRSTDHLLPSAHTFGCQDSLPWRTLWIAKEIEGRSREKYLRHSYCNSSVRGNVGSLWHHRSPTGGVSRTEIAGLLADGLSKGAPELNYVGASTGTRAHMFTRTK
jgi:hypothetical protein